jgi:hypothetical protein
MAGAQHKVDGLTALRDSFLSFSALLFQPANRPQSKRCSLNNYQFIPAIKSLSEFTAFFVSPPQQLYAHSSVANCLLPPYHFPESPLHPHSNPFCAILPQALFWLVGAASAGLLLNVTARLCR